MKTADNLKANRCECHLRALKAHVGTLNVKTVTNVTTATYVKNENTKCKNSTLYVKKCHKCEKRKSHKCKIHAVTNVKRPFNRCAVFVQRFSFKFQLSVLYDCKPKAAMIYSSTLKNVLVILFAERVIFSVFM